MFLDNEKGLSDFEKGAEGRGKKPGR